MDSIKIRKATLADLNTLLAFEQGVIAAERPFDPTLKEEIISYYDIRKMIPATDVEIIVAVVDNQIIASGYARLEVAKPYLKHKNYGHLGFMYTIPEYRGQGVNAKIIAALKEWCNSQDATEIRLDVYSDNENAIKAYTKFGFKKHLTNMRLNP